MASQLHANAARDRSSFRVRPSSNTCATVEFAYSDRYVYVGELESSNPRARYDLPFPHFIDPPCYTNKLVAPPHPPTPKESYPDATGRSLFLLSFRKSMTFLGASRPLEMYFRDVTCEQRNALNKWHIMR